MSARGLLFVACAAGFAVALGAYAFWPLGSFDDGPFYSAPYSGSVEPLALGGEVQLRRFGAPAYTLEVRDLGAADPGSVFALRARSGEMLWSKVPVHDGPLGRIRFCDTGPTLMWWGGWAVCIKPEFQESGVLYLGPFGGFKSFYHSW